LNILLPIASAKGLKFNKIATTINPIDFFIISAFRVKSDLPNACSKFKLTKFKGSIRDEAANICTYIIASSHLEVRKNIINGLARAKTSKHKGNVIKQTSDENLL
jgi:hypothetical protein